MKFNCGPNYETWRKEKEAWHRWFAWHPVMIGSRDCRWLETVERRYIFGNTGTMRDHKRPRYRAIDKEDTT